MTWLARLAAAVTCAAAALLSAVARAQPAGSPEPPSEEGRFAWLWIVAAVLVVAALVRMFFGRSGRTAPPRAP